MCQCASDWWRMPHTDGKRQLDCAAFIIVQWTRLIAHRIDAISDLLGREHLDIHERSSGNSANEHTTVDGGELMGLRTPRIFEPIVLAGGGRGSSLVLKNLGQHRLIRPFLVSSSERHFIKPAPQVPFFSLVILPCFCNNVLCFHEDVYECAFFPRRRERQAHA